MILPKIILIKSNLRNFVKLNSKFENISSEHDMAIIIISKS